MKISQNGVDLLKQFEGISLDAYQDAGGTWTIGYGQTYYEDGRPVQSGDHISLEQAYSLYESILPRYEAIVNKHLGILELTQNQYDALVSFAYNLGEGPTIEAINAIKSNTFTREFMLQYVHAGGKRIQGLVNRRNKEADLFFSGVKEVTKEVIKEVPINNAYIEGEGSQTVGEAEAKIPLFMVKTKNRSFEINGSSTKFFMYAIGISFIWLTAKGILGKSDYMNIAVAVVSYYLGMKAGNK